MTNECGGCQGLGNHRRHCRHNPDYTYARELADMADSLADQIGSNNAGAANHCYAAAGLLMQQHRELLAARDLRVAGDVDEPEADQG